MNFVFRLGVKATSKKADHVHSRNYLKKGKVLCFSILISTLHNLLFLYTN